LLFSSKFFKLNSGKRTSMTCFVLL